MVDTQTQAQGLSRREIRAIRDATRSWLGGCTIDLVGDVGLPAVVLQANEDPNWTAYHIERSEAGFVVTATQGDVMSAVGTFPSIEMAICSLGSTTLQ